MLCRAWPQWLLLGVVLLTSSRSEADEDVVLDFPESVELHVVVDYVAATLGFNITYDANQLREPVALRVAQPVPKAELLSLLRSLLRTRALALVPATQHGWYRVVSVERLAAEPRDIHAELPPSDGDPGEVITYGLTIEHADIQRIEAAIKPYLSKAKANTLVVDERRLLVITDFADNVRRAAELARLMDNAPAATVIEMISVHHQDPAELATRVTGLLAELHGTQAFARDEAAISLRPDPTTGELLALGTPTLIAQARELVERFDVPSRRQTEVYQPRYVSADRMRALIEALVRVGGSQMAVEPTTNTLVVTALADQHRQIRELVARYDTTPPDAATPLRFYKLLNRRADDVFATLAALLEDPSRRSTTSAILGGVEDSELVRDTMDYGAATEDLSTSAPQPPEPRTTTTSSAATRVAIQGEGYSLSLDEHTNSIIAIATPELQLQIEQLVAQLDRRRPQVLVEVTLVSLSEDDSETLGVELNALENGKWDLHLFTAFGLSDLSVGLGDRDVDVSPGGTGVLMGPEEVPIILQALANLGNTRVYSAPRILVDDNATGRIESVAESPYTSVNASDTVATTSFAGFAKAGTQLSIEPHIAEGDHVELQYTLTVSSFTGAGKSTVPPPRSSNTISSTIRVPDSHTVVVGGLLTETVGESASQVPLLGDLPGVGWLFGSRSHSVSKVRLYAFIRPTILRQETFEDLKYISRAELAAAELDDGMPPTRFQYMAPYGPLDLDMPAPAAPGSDLPRIEE